MHRCCLLVCVLFGIVVPAMAAEPSAWQFDFENGVPDALESHGAGITDDPAIVVAGKRSLLADFSQSDGSWHEFLHTKPSIAFEKGKTYAVRFEYRIVSNEDPKIQFYSLMKSRTGKGDIGGDNWLWRWPTGYTGHINRLFPIPHEGGYDLIIGVRHNGAIAIDELEIHEARPNEAAREIRVDTHESPLERRRRLFDRKHRMVSQMLGNMLIIVLNEGAGTKAHEAKDRIVRDLDPDFVDWNIFGPLAKEYGIRSSTGGCEYQEYYKFEGSADPARREHVWENRYEIFGDSGFVITLDNTVISDESWGAGGYFTCHNGPNWHRHFIDTLQDKAKRFLAITQDNISCSVFNRVKGCYCPGCQQRFREVLADRWSDRQLAAVGISDVEQFSIQDYIVDHGLLERAALEDGLVREYMKFQYTSGILNWADCVEAAKSIAARQKRPLPCGGNQINAWGSWPYAVTLSQFCDFVEIEELVGVKNKVSPRVLQYKLGLASAHHERPVWVRGPVTDETVEKMPMLSTSYWTVHFAEALANGGIREFSLGLNKPYTGDPDVPDYMDDKELYKLYVDFARWMREHRALLTNRESQARVALVYSLPSLMFRRYDALRTPDDYRLPKFENTSKLLDRSQIPYDVIVFGHPEIWDDTDTFERARERYDVIVLAGVDALTDDQMAFLRERQKAGVILLADEPFERDENLNLRKSAPSGLRPRELTEASLIEHGRKASRVRVDVPEHVSVNVWRSCRGRSFDVHLLNYDADVVGETMNPVKNVALRVQPPDDLKIERCVISRYGQPDVETDFERVDDTVAVNLPQLDAYTIVSFTDRTAIPAMQRRLEQFISSDRAWVKKIAKRLDLY